MRNYLAESHEAGQLLAPRTACMRDSNRRLLFRLQSFQVSSQDSTWQAVVDVVVRSLSPRHGWRSRATKTFPAVERQLHRARSSKGAPCGRIAFAQPQLHQPAGDNMIIFSSPLRLFKQAHSPCLRLSRFPLTVDQAHRHAWCSESLSFLLITRVRYSFLYLLWNPCFPAVTNTTVFVA